MIDPSTGMALQRNSNVIDLVAILEAHGRKEPAQDFRALAEQVDRMEHQLHAATLEIAAMRRELTALRELHGEPLHNTARQNIDTAARQIAQAKERLGAIKDKIVQGAKDAVAAIREKGIGALNSAVSFLGVRKELENIRRDSLEGIVKCERSMARVDSISRQYHEVGTATRNFGRALTGKEIRDDTKESGKLAALAAAPFRSLKKLHSGLVKGADAALGKLEKLEQAAKPSMLENLQTMKEAAKEQAAIPLPEKMPREPSL